MKELTIIQKRIIKEVSSINDIIFLSNRIDYISSVFLYLQKFGLSKFVRRYPSLNKQFRPKDLIFYLQALQNRKEKLMRLQELDYEKYRKNGVL